MPLNAPARFIVPVVLAMAIGTNLQAQPTLAGSASTAATAAKTDPRGKKVLGLADIARFKRINSAALSSDGSWMTFIYQPNEGDDTLFVKQLPAGKSYTIPLASEPQFSDDARFVGYFVSPAEGRGGRGGRGGGGGGRGAQPGATPAPTPPRRFELLELATGAKYEVPTGASFKFSKGSKYLAVKAAKANATAKHNGTDLVLRDLTTGVSQNIGNVDTYDFDDAGHLLAYTVDAAERIGNGVYVLDLGDGPSRASSARRPRITTSSPGATKGLQPRCASRRQEEGKRSSATTPCSLGRMREPERHAPRNTIRPRMPPSRRRWS